MVMHTTNFKISKSFMIVFVKIGKIVSEIWKIQTPLMLDFPDKMDSFPEKWKLIKTGAPKCSPHAAHMQLAQLQFLKEMERLRRYKQL